MEMPPQLQRLDNVPKVKAIFDADSQQLGLIETLKGFEFPFADSTHDENKNMWLTSYYPKSECDTALNDKIINIFCPTSMIILHVVGFE